MTVSRPVIGLLHGWGMNGRLFDELAVRLAPDFDVRVLELPGHGGRAMLAVDSLAAWTDAVVAELPSGATLLGWSLGGQVALRAALDHPEVIARLVLVATTPRFLRADRWACGIPESDLNAFASSLVADPRATLLRFLSLQTRGAPDAKQLLQRVRAVMASTPSPAAAALAQGLALLRETDLRRELGAVRQPTLVLHGALDTLTPIAAGRWLTRHIPSATGVELARAAHAPHLSHADAVSEHIGRFVHD